MTLWVEIGGAFWLWPQYRKHGYMRRVFWLWFGIGWMPVSFGEWVNSFGLAMREHTINKMYNGGEEE